MSHVVTSTCVKCKYTDCVEVCPVDCFHEAEDVLYIDPYECIDCEACIPVCPVLAIFHEDNVPPAEHRWIKLNADLAPTLPVITLRKPALAPYPPKHG